MNLLSDLSSELAIAILVDKKYSKEVSSNDAYTLISRIYEVLEPISTDEELPEILLSIKEVQTTAH